MQKNTDQSSVKVLNDCLEFIEARFVQPVQDCLKRSNPVIALSEIIKYEGDEWLVSTKKSVQKLQDQTEIINDEGDEWLVSAKKFVQMLQDQTKISEEEKARRYTDLAFGFCKQFRELFHYSPFCILIGGHSSFFSADISTLICQMLPDYTLSDKKELKTEELVQQLYRDAIVEMNIDKQSQLLNMNGLYVLYSSKMNASSEDAIHKKIADIMDRRKRALNSVVQEWSAFFSNILRKGWDMKFVVPQIPVVGGNLQSWVDKVVNRAKTYLLAAEISPQEEQSLKDFLAREKVGNHIGDIRKEVKKIC